MQDLIDARANMVDSQLRPNAVTDPAVIEAFLTVPRELFVPQALRGVAYVDEDMPLGHGRFLIEPMILARLAQALAVERSESALVVGAATGYAAAIMAGLARHVVALEEDDALAATARTALREAGIDNVAVVQGALPAGYGARAPYGVILIAGAVAEVPPALFEQLAERGRLAAVLRSASPVARLAAPGQAVLWERVGGALSRRGLFDANIPYLPGFEPAAGFVF